MSLVFEHSLEDAVPHLAAPASPRAYPDPELILLNTPLAAELGLDVEMLHANAAAWFGGGALPASVQPRAFAYAGHQFGHFAGTLGDGRAALLGERVLADGTRMDVQLKGIGRTTFSRGGDGRAALDSVLREYLLSEAMHALGIPTTRALAAVRTGDTVTRYRTTPGGVLARVARSHLRVGTMEYLAVLRDVAGLSAVVGLAIQRHYPHLAETPNPALALLQAVGEAQAKLVAQWMGVGFIHGVMNTDNMALSGETLDYGPAAFMDITRADTVFSLVDEGGRYAYGNQPGIAVWNLVILAQSLLPVIDPDADTAVRSAEEVLRKLQQTFAETRLKAMCAKIGLSDSEPEDAELVADLWKHMEAQALDFTATYRQMASDLRNDRPILGGRLMAWTPRWKARLRDTPAATADAMDRVNPAYIPRNHQVERVLNAAIGGDYAPFKTFLNVLADPFNAQEGLAAYAEPPPPDAAPFWTHCNT